MKYRTRQEIVVNILTVANDNEGITKTKVMYQAYLSYAQLSEYLAVLLENGMLEKSDSNKYKTTTKGVEMMNAYDKLNDLIGVKND